jgi:hypothetical protein
MDCPMLWWPGTLEIPRDGEQGSCAEEPQSHDGAQA